MCVPEFEFDIGVRHGVGDLGFMGFASRDEGLGV